MVFRLHCKELVSVNINVDTAINCIFNCKRGIKDIAKSLDCYNNDTSKYTSVIQTKNSNNYGVDYIARQGNYLNGYRQFCNDDVLNSKITISKYVPISETIKIKNIKILSVFNNWYNINWSIISYSETLNVLTVYSGHNIINHSCGVIITIWNKQNNWSQVNDIHLITNILPYSNPTEFNNMVKLSSKYPNIPTIFSEDSYAA